VIPNKNKYLIVAFFNAPTILARRWPSLQSNLAVLAPYNLMYYAQSITLEFLYGIGYEGNIVCEYTNSEPCCILAGGGENWRMGYKVVCSVSGVPMMPFYSTMTLPGTTVLSQVVLLAIMAGVIRRWNALTAGQPVRQSAHSTHPGIAGFTNLSQ
jgi:hypothetical protein